MQVIEFFTFYETEVNLAWILIFLWFLSSAHEYTPIKAITFVTFFSIAFMSVVINLLVGL